ncbi:glutaminase [candidate division GN15 bacterium]|nr:glutaminase [candidate division GN15 bacterium]
MEYEKILEDIAEDVLGGPPEGAVADYISELARVDPDKFGMSLYCLEDDAIYAIGDSEERFSIQSISKVLALTLALSIDNEEIWERVDVEPSGDPFNSLVQLEYEEGIPRNPLINPGAIVVADMLISRLESPKQALLEFVQSLSGLDDIGFNETVASSEADTGHRNFALANLLKAFGNIDNDVDEVLDFYFHMCSIEMSCSELAQTFAYLANHGRTSGRTGRIITKTQTKRVNAIMQTCGFYDEAGEFTFRVGLPGKSGVGGGIVAIHPQEYSVAVWSPRLNEKGNSHLGMRALELLTSRTGSSIF